MNEQIEKVKKGLKQCALSPDMDEYETQCHDCPYFAPEVTVEDCRKALFNDAKAKIESIQAENKELRGKIASLKDTLRRAKPNWIIE